MSNSFIMTESIVRPAKMPYGRLKDNGFVGIEGEHAARALVVETKDDLSAFASVNLIIDDLDCGAMTKTTSGNTTTLSMTLTSSMIGRSGRKICQLIMVNSGNTVVQKSSQFEAYVGRANEIERSVDDGVTIIILSEAVTEMAREAAAAAAEEAVADVVEDCQAIADAASASADAAAQSATDAQTAAASITVDATLDPTSTHAIQNKAVASEISSIKADLGDKVEYTHSSSTSLKNCDLDDIVTPGSYRVTNIANSRTVVHIPEEKGGVLQVSVMESNSNIWQRYIVSSVSEVAKIYDRIKLGDSGWTEWLQVTNAQQIGKLLPIDNTRYISLSQGDDINDITTVGAYKSTSASVTGTLLNKPALNIGFVMFVVNVVSNSTILQIVIGSSNDAKMFIRWANPSIELFGDWIKIAYDDVNIDDTLASMGASITNNASRIAVLEAQSGIEGDYFTQFEEQEQALYDKVNNDIDKNTLVFLVSADNHYRETKPEGEHQVYHAEVMAKIAKRLRADAIINLGDIITQYIDSVDDEVYANTDITAAEVNTMRLAKMATAFQSTGVPFLYTLAHHEMSLHTNGPTSTDNTTQTSVYPYPESKVLGLCGKGAEWIEEHHYTQDPLSAGYYVDFSRHKVRLIFIDSVSYSAVGFSPNSIAFITEAFSNVPSGYKVIVCSHAATRGPGVYYSTMKNWEPVENIMSNFVSNGGTILAILHGHDHYDNVVFIDGVPYPYISICCAENSWHTVGEKIEAGVQGNPVSYKAHSATRGDAIGTYNEWLFDIMCVHPDTNTLKFFRFGIGEDRTVTLATS